MDGMRLSALRSLLFFRRGGEQASGAKRVARTIDYFMPREAGKDERAAMRTMPAKKPAPREWQARFNAAAKAAQRDYCNIFAFWTTCRYKPCRRTKRCEGDALACLKRGFDQVPGDVRQQAFARVIAQTPDTADSPTKTARRFSPFDFTCW